MARLQVAGHQIVELAEDQTHVVELMQLAWAYLSLDNTGYPLVKASGEPFVLLGGKGMDILQSQDQSPLKAIERLEPFSKLPSLTVIRGCLRDAWRTPWQRYGLDAVISPPYHHAAVPHDTFLLPPFTAFLNTFSRSCKRVRITSSVCSILLASSRLAMLLLKTMQSLSSLRKVIMKCVSFGTTWIPANMICGPIIDVPHMCDDAPTAIQVLTSSLRDE